MLFILTQNQVLSETISDGYQYFREHWYVMSLEEAEAPDFSCVCFTSGQPIAFSWHDLSSGFLHKFFLLSLNSCLDQGSGLPVTKCSYFQLG